MTTPRHEHERHPEKDNRDGASSARRRHLISTGVLVAFVLGVAFLVVFNTALEWTNREDFCLSCHEMKDNVYREYQGSIHYTNRSGVRAVCADCHVPKSFLPKIVRKLRAANEVWHTFRGTIDTPEKFDARRPQLAQREWRRMSANDSQECRNCHDADSFDYSMQSYRATDQHMETNGQTCIDCHKGVAHRLPTINQGAADSANLVAKLFHSGTNPKED
ncbi:MAG: NapC/NirT family cytochrome c [Azoarcus sp.]|jgi:cytochrome c-type protein NapC|nr:NapC/NirT family cytochrome c [Azoarcus sp.]